MAVVESAPITSRVRAVDDAAPRSGGAYVKGWAAAGAIALAFIAYVLIRWVTGPYFKTVPSGPSVPPDWMSTALTIWQTAGWALVAWFFWHFLIAPWRRDGRPSSDGLMCVACGILYFQDPLGNYFQHWFTYNTTLVQFGSWVNDIPGWMSFGRPGHMLTEPILFTGQVYVWWFFGCAVLGSWVMRTAHARWPRLGTFGLIVIAFTVAATVDLVLEGLVMMPLGAYVYPGATGPMLFKGTYHQFPIEEALFAGLLFGGLTCLRYFKNDRGETIAERGVDNLNISQRRKSLLRFLALVGAVQTVMLLGYNIPVATLIGAHSGTWPRSIQERSYFTSGICGQGTGRLCPDTSLPNTRGSDGIYIGANGRIVIPPGVHLPRIVPFKRAW